MKLRRKALQAKLDEEINISFLRRGLNKEFLSPRSYFKIAFKNVALDTDGLEYFHRYKSKAEAIKAAKAMFIGDNFENVRIIYVLEYRTEVERIK